MEKKLTGPTLAQAIFDRAGKLSGALTSRQMQTIWFTVDQRVGSIRLWDGYIVEMEIPQADFWAHFDGNDAATFYDHLHAFFKVLRGASRPDILDVSAIRPMKLLIICTSGVTSSIAARQINELARQNDWNVAADWSPASQAKEKSLEADVVLYAPQAAAAFHALPEPERRHSALIPPADFAMMNSEAMVCQAERLLA